MTTSDISRIVAEAVTCLRNCNEELAASGRYSRRIENAASALEAIAQQPSNAVPEDSCNWQQEDCESDCWSTDCGNLFSINDGTPSDNQMAHCCYCGKKVTETQWVPEDEQDEQP